MALVQPSAARFQRDETPEGLRIVIPARRNWFFIAFLLFWLGAWTFGEISVIRQLANGQARESFPFLLFWLGGWTVGGILAAYNIGWMLVGQEIVCAKRFPPCLSVQRQLLGIQLRSREFDSGQILRLRVSSETQNPSAFGNQSAWPGGACNIAFDYGVKTQRFGSGLDDAEAQIIVSALHERWPSTKG